MQHLALVIWLLTLLAARVSAGPPAFPIDLETAATLFDEPFRRPGWRTDRGQVFLKYGRPVRRTVRSADFEGPASELWEYESPRRLFFFVDERGSDVYPVRLPPQPHWYGDRTSSGLEMSCVGVLQGTYLGIYVGPTCAFWRDDARLNCRFCTTGLNPIAPKGVADVVETAQAAKEESGLTFVHFNTGYQRGAALRLVAPYVAAVKREVGALVGVQVFPETPLEDFEVRPSEGWGGGFFCPCHGSTFDLAGRVYKGVPAPTNLRVPPHRFVRDDLILIGQDTGAA